MGPSTETAQGRWAQEACICAACAWCVLLNMKLSDTSDTMSLSTLQNHVQLFICACITAKSMLVDRCRPRANCPADCAQPLQGGCRILDYLKISRTSSVCSNCVRTERWAGSTWNWKPQAPAPRCVEHHQPKVQQSVSADHACGETISASTSLRIPDDDLICCATSMRRGGGPRSSPASNMLRAASAKHEASPHITSGIGADIHASHDLRRSAVDCTCRCCVPKHTSRHVVPSRGTDGITDDAPGQPCSACSQASP